MREVEISEEHRTMLEEYKYERKALRELFSKLSQESRQRSASLVRSLANAEEGDICEWDGKIIKVYNEQN